MVSAHKFEDDGASAPDKSRARSSRSFGLWDLEQSVFMFLSARPKGPMYDRGSGVHSSPPPPPPPSKNSRGQPCVREPRFTTEIVAPRLGQRVPAARAPARPCHTVDPPRPA